MTATVEPVDVAKILIVDDARPFQVLLENLLTNEGYETIVAGDGQSGLDKVRLHDPDLIVLDLGLPDIDGLKVCELIRGFSDAYIIMLTGRSDQQSKYAGLDVGADEYLSKPCPPEELMLRIRVLLRRQRTPSTTLLKGHQASPQPAHQNGDLKVGSLRIDLATRQTFVQSNEVKLTKIEFAIATALAQSAGLAVRREDLARAVWGPDWVGSDHVVNVHVANLRNKICIDASVSLQTIRGYGYKLVDPAAQLVTTD